MKPDDLRIVASLLRAERIAALATLRDGGPFASMVAFAPEADFSGFLMHLSALSPHTRHLAADSRASLLITEHDDGREDPQTLARITLIGQVAQLARDAAEYRVACDLYGARLPASAMLFDFADFSMFRLVPSEARFVGGFARAYTLNTAQLKDCAALAAQ